jgi:hypothetical protein
MMDALIMLIMAAYEPYNCIQVKRISLRINGNTANRL